MSHLKEEVLTVRPKRSLSLAPPSPPEAHGRSAPNRPRFPASVLLRLFLAVDSRKLEICVGIPSANNVRLPILLRRPFVGYFFHPLFPPILLFSSSPFPLPPLLYSLPLVPTFLPISLSLSLSSCFTFTSTSHSLLPPVLSLLTFLPPPPPPFYFSSRPSFPPLSLLLSHLFPPYRPSSPLSFSLLFFFLPSFFSPLLYLSLLILLFFILLPSLSSPPFLLPLFILLPLLILLLPPLPLLLPLSPFSHSFSLPSFSSSSSFSPPPPHYPPSSSPPSSPSVIPLPDWTLKRPSGCPALGYEEGPTLTSSLSLPFFPSPLPHLLPFSLSLLTALFASSLSPPPLPSPSLYPSLTIALPSSLKLPHSPTPSPLLSSLPAYPRT
ncbi:hypothetical protein C7M84_025311 [Penaeus vannamei]|uniref:Uncharacterized protein n=1 Tax=Penaeus vannamei TaxID=6689 RepID=A0A3R7MH25_PENVA|nr:hypothetical protein C7M84_025311 [Penaeus vannamei]